MYNEKQVTMKTGSEYLSLPHDYMQKKADKYAITHIGTFGSVMRNGQTDWLEGA